MPAVARRARTRIMSPFKAIADRGRLYRSPVVPAGWALYNGVWIGVMGAFGVTALPLWIYSCAVSLTVALAGALTISCVHHKGGAKRRYAITARSDAGLYAALTIAFAGLWVIQGAWWAPLSAVMFVLTLSMTAKDMKVRHRALRRGGPA